MAYLDNTVPADTESIKTGAQRVRDLKTSLNAVLGQIFSDAGAFLSKWITTGQIADKAVGAGQLADGAVGTAQIAAGALSADTAGRAKMADGFLTVAKLALGFAMPTASIGADAIAAGAVGATQLAAEAVTPPAAGTGVAKVAIGTYSGSNSASAAVTGLAFAPDFLLIVRSGQHQVFTAFRSEASAGIGPVRQEWNGAALIAPNATAIQWSTDGFTVAPFNAAVNQAGSTYTFLALKV